jgi:hypothetical protein
MHSDDNLRQLTEALTVGTQIYATAIAQRQQQSANAIFMQSIAMKMHNLPMNLQARLCADIMKLVYKAQLEYKNDG